MKRILKILKYTLIVVVCFELALWVLGFRPYRYVYFKVDTKPQHAILGDSVFGFRLSPGSFEITLQDTLVFNANHDQSGRRVIPNAASTEKQNKIHFLGCSYTYGYGVNDDESFAAITQKQFPNYKVVNHAVMGYGTVQSLIQVRNTDEIQPDDAVVLCFSDAHFMRNVLSNAYRLHLKIGFENSANNLGTIMKNARFPYLTNCTTEPKFESWENIYSHWPLREYSPGINFIQSQIEGFADRQIDDVKATACIIEEISEITQNKGAQFLVVCLDTSTKTKALQQLTKVPFWINVGFDFGDTLLTNYPYDQHPNANGHITIANEIIPAIESVIND